MKLNQNGRGFEIGEFLDRNGKKCSLQKSSLATEDCIWLGCNDIGLQKFSPGKGWEEIQLEQDPSGVVHIANTRMHLTRDQVAELLPHLIKFVTTGELK